MDIGVDATISRIRAYALFRDWKKSRLATEAGLNDTTLRDFDDPTWNPRAKTLRKLESIIPADFYATVATRAAQGVAA